MTTAAPPAIPATGRFSIPRQRRTLLPRPRLTERLHGGVGNGLIVVQAPAGFGKTALLSAFAGEIDYNVRWLSLDASCNAPEVFAQQLAAALLGEEAAGAPATAAKTDDLRAYLGGALQAATAASGAPLMLVVDNVHEIRDAMDSAELLGWLLEVLPEGAELVLSGREHAPLTAIDERIATGACLVLGADDLAFTVDEIRALARQGGHDVDAEALAPQTGGWPVGVLAVLACSVSAEGELNREAGAAWERYVISEVLAHVPSELRPVLLRLSVPEVVGEDTAEALVGRPRWREMSAWLARHDFLYEPLAGDGLRLNPLWRQFLLAEFQRVEPDEFARAVAATVRRLEADGRVADALELARSGHDWETLAGLLERQSARLIYQGCTALLWRGYEVLPASTLEARPVLRAIRARVLCHVERPHEALEAAEDVLADAAAPCAAHLNAMLAKVRAFRLLSRIDDLKEMFLQIHEAPECEEPGLVAELKYQEAFFELNAAADFTTTERLLNETIAICRAQGGILPLELLAVSTLGQVLTMRGDGPASVNMLTQAAQGWRELGKSSNLGWVLNNLGMAYLQVGDFESAAAALEEARSEGEACENSRNTAYAIASLGDAELALGHYDKARQYFEATIKICAEGVPDESLTALSIAGLSSAMVGLGELQEADFFCVRSNLVAAAFGNPFEVGTCQLQRAQVDSATGNHVGAVSAATEAISLFASIDGQGSLRTAYYRLALCHFRANHRSEAQKALAELEALLTEPWMVGALLPMVRENPMFAQWVASRNLAGPSFRDAIERNAFTAFATAEGTVEPVPTRLPRVVARSLGTTHVAVGGRDVTDEAWASLRAKELFFLFLANRSGLRKEEAVEALYPELPREKCNSAFHSNLYRVRRALYSESVVKRDGTYLLNPEGDFEWDVEEFEAALARAQKLPRGSEERAQQYRKALDLYRGPFAESFGSEWAETVRRRSEERATEALSLLAGYYAGREDFEGAAVCMEQVLRHDQYNDEAAYRLASYRAKAGQPVVALAIIDDYRRIWEADLGGEMPERFVRLRAQIATGAAG
jgi:ATP/maltotriose-dependent transcriptional regulator MalT/DNA-binding SARP family transcriptional activator